MAKGLKRCTIALAGDFGAARTVDKIKMWIDIHGGRFALDITSAVTHLVCSLSAYKRNAPTVAKALEYDTIKIVTFDWLEESLLDGEAKGTKPYLVRKKIKQRRRRKKARRDKREETMQKAVAKFKEDCHSFREYMQAEGYEIYRDESGFYYNVALARVYQSNLTNERYHLKVGHLPTPIFPCYYPQNSRIRLDKPPTQQLQLFQTHEIPRRYACFAVYAPREGVSKGHVLAPPCSSFELAMSQFEQYFKEKTQFDWRDRFETEKNAIIAPDEEHLPKVFGYATKKDWYDPRRPDVEW